MENWVNVNFREFAKIFLYKKLQNPFQKYVNNVK